MKYNEDDLTQTDWFRTVAFPDNSIEACANKVHVDLINIRHGSIFKHVQTEQNK